MIAVAGIKINNVHSTMASIGVRFGRTFLMVREFKAVNFYQNGLGMAVVGHTDNWAELTCPVGTRTPHTIGSTTLGVGYSPFLSLDVDNTFTLQWLDARKWVPILMDQYNIPHMEKLLLLH